MLYSLIFFTGLGLLTLGSYLLIQSLVSLSKMLSIKPLFLSIFVLGFVTSSAEWVVTFISSYKGIPVLALSNVIGSNTINILFVLGLSGLFCAISKIDKQIFKFDLPVLVLAFVLLGFSALDGVLSRWDSFLCLFVFGLYLFALFKQRKQESVSEEIPDYQIGLPRSLIYLGLGFIGLFMGSHLMINSSLGVGQLLGLSERFIGVLILALGTSLPEIATSVMAALKKEGDMILGNIVGSNIFNSLFVISSAGLMNSLPVSEALYKDYFFMFGVAAALWASCWFLKAVPKWVCGFFLLTYFGYVWTLFL